MAGPPAVPREVYGCLLARFDGPQPPGWLLDWLDRGLAGVLLMAQNVGSRDQLRSVTSQLREHNPQVLIAADEEGGIVTRVEAAAGSSYPGNAALGAIDDVELTRRVAASIGAMLADRGISVDLAPVADTDVNPANPVIGVRSFGARPDRVAAHTAAFVRGLQAAGVAACAKHFPGHGRTDTDSHLELPSVAATLPELVATDLAPFRAAIAAGVESVMTAHVLFPAIDSVPATMSRRLLHDVLRTELGFDGVVITDALDMAAIAGRPEGPVAALAAGADLLCLPADRGRTGAGEGHRGDRAAQRRPGPAAGGSGRAARRGTRHPGRPGPGGARRPGARADRGPPGAARRRAGAAAHRTPYVLDAGGWMSTQLEDSAASLLGLLRGLWPGTSGARLTGPADLTGVEGRIAAAAGRPVVVVVRDAHRHDWQRELLAAVLALRPDALVVGTGTTHDRGLAGGAYLGTRGASRASLVAAAALLAGQPPEQGAPPAGGS